MQISDDYIMPFGAHAGQKMKDVPASYLDWLSGQTWTNRWPEVVAYIEQNRKHINQELERKERE